MRWVCAGSVANPSTTAGAAGCPAQGPPNPTVRPLLQEAQAHGRCGDTRKPEAECLRHRELRAPAPRPEARAPAADWKPWDQGPIPGDVVRLGWGPRDRGTEPAADAQRHRRAGPRGCGLVRRRGKRLPWLSWRSIPLLFPRRCLQAGQAGWCDRQVHTSAPSHTGQ